MDWPTFWKFYKLEYGNHDFWNQIVMSKPLNLKQLDIIYEWVSKIWIARHQTLSERWIRKHKEDIELKWCCIYQHLSEEFIREFQDELNWTAVSINQHLSEKFIEEMRDKVNWMFIFDNQTLTQKFKDKHSDKMRKTVNHV